MTWPVAAQDVETMARGSLLWWGVASSFCHQYLLSGHLNTDSQQQKKEVTSSFVAVKLQLMHHCSCTTCHQCQPSGYHAVLLLLGPPRSGSWSHCREDAGSSRRGRGTGDRRVRHSTRQPLGLHLTHRPNPMLLKSIETERNLITQ